MFLKGDLIIYNNEGVCRVEDVAPLKNLSDSESSRMYYKLTPIYSKGSILIPVDTKVFMRPIMTSDEANKLIAKIPEIKGSSVDINNQKQLNEYYQSSFVSHECEDLLQLIKTVYIKTQKQIMSGKKPGQTDQRYMKRAEELLHGELAAALNIPYEDISKYIENELSLESGKIQCG
ncbi:hypothetical protein IMSAG049_00657 [Clostridiales bacterium]|nr:hypothetical protein IMSAG049_00657 [Clostridiales bacterium]